MARPRKNIEIVQTADADAIAHLMADQLKLNGQEAQPKEDFVPHLTSAGTPNPPKRRPVPTPKAKPLTFD